MPIIIVGLIVLAVLSAPLYGIVSNLAGYEPVRWFLGLAKEGPRLEREHQMAISMAIFLLIVAVIVHAVVASKTQRRVDVVAVGKRALGSVVAAVAFGFLVTRLLTWMGLDRSALILGPMLATLGLVGFFYLRGVFSDSGGSRGAGGTGPSVGEIWWADVPFEEVADSKDRPSLVIDVSEKRAVVLMITSQDKSGQKGYIPIPTTGWDKSGKSSWLKIDRPINIQLRDFRRYAGPCPEVQWRFVQERVMSVTPSGAPGAAAPTSPYRRAVEEAGAAALAPSRGVPIPVPMVPADPQAPVPWRVPEPLPEAVHAGSGAESLLVVLALDAARIRSRSLQEPSYEPDFLAEVRGAATRCDLPHLWLLAVTETCRAYAGVVAETITQHGPDRDTAAATAACVEMMWRLRWCSRSPWAVPAVITGSAGFAPYRYAVAATTAEEMAQGIVAAFQDVLKDWQLV
jgi:hypothetical protein